MAQLFYNICPVVAYRRLKLKESFSSKNEKGNLALRVVTVAYERWSLTTGSKYCDFDFETFVVLENLLLRRGGSQPEVRL